MDSATFKGHGPSGILLGPKLLSRYCLSLLHGYSGFEEESFYSNPGKDSPAHGSGFFSPTFLNQVILLWGVGMEVGPYGIGPPSVSCDPGKGSY